MAAKPSPRLLVVADSPDTCEQLVRDALDAGFEVAATSVCHNLVQTLPQLALDGVLIRVDEAGTLFLDSLETCLAMASCPLAVFVERSDPALTQRAIAMGTHAWVVAGYAPHRLRDVMRVADMRWQREAAWHARIDDARRELDDRKWIERAKGLLMSARAVDEAQAYRLLRSTAMQRQARLGQVSRILIDASNWAEAVNRAGQLRMLSQRLVRVFAQRLVKVNVRRATELQAQSLLRAHENIARLERLVPASLRQAASPATADAWQALQSVVEGRLSADDLAHADRCAETLLQAAEQLTRALELASGHRALHIVNLSGRQRMLAQRVAKEAMLAAVRPSPGPHEPLSAALRDFEAALAVLEAAPLGSDEIRRDLAAAREAWLRMLRSNRSADDMTALAECAAASDVLVEIFDRLTERYQTSLEALMG
jgi:AmiR/NasT family two-component response regulator